MPETAAHPDLRWLSSASVCEMLDIGERTLRRWISTKGFPQAVRIAGTTKRWKLADVQAWIDENSEEDAHGAHEKTRSGGSSAHRVRVA